MVAVAQNHTPPEFLASLKPHTPLPHMQELGLRYYNPGLGRWISRDPIGEWGGGGLYVFVNNNPIDIIDRLGLQAGYGGGGNTVGVASCPIATEKKAVGRGFVRIDSEWWIETQLTQSGLSLPVGIYAVPLADLVSTDWYADTHGFVTGQTNIGGVRCRRKKSCMQKCQEYCCGMPTGLPPWWAKWDEDWTFGSIGGVYPNWECLVNRGSLNTECRNEGGDDKCQ